MTDLKNSRTVPYILGLLLSITMAVVIRLVIGSQLYLDAIGSVSNPRLIPAIGLLGALLAGWFGSLELAVGWLGDRIKNDELYIANVTGFLAIVLSISCRLFPQISPGHLQEITLIIMIASMLGVWFVIGVAISGEARQQEMMKSEPEEEKKREHEPRKTGSIMTTSPMHRSWVRRLR